MTGFNDINRRNQHSEVLYGPRKHPHEVLAERWAFTEEYRRRMNAKVEILMGVNVEIQFFARHKFPSLQLWGPCKDIKIWLDMENDGTIRHIILKTFIPDTCTIIKETAQMYIVYIKDSIALLKLRPLLQKSISSEISVYGADSFEVSRRCKLNNPAAAAILNTFKFAYSEIESKLDNQNLLAQQSSCLDDSTSQAIIYNEESTFNKKWPLVEGFFDKHPVNQGEAKNAIPVMIKELEDTLRIFEIIEDLKYLLTSTLDWLPRQAPAIFGGHLEGLSSVYRQICRFLEDCQKKKKKKNF